MLISEVIKGLQEKQDTHGDMELTVIGKSSVEHSDSIYLSVYIPSEWGDEGEGNVRTRLFLDGEVFVQ
jgi:hypothetical protein